MKGGRGLGGFEGERTGRRRRHLAMLENLRDEVTTATALRALAKAYAPLAAARSWKRAGPERRPGGVREVTSQ